MIYVICMVDEESGAHHASLLILSWNVESFYI